MALGRLRQLLLGGEALSEVLASELLKVVRGELINVYGPTETTIWSSIRITSIRCRVRCRLDGPIARHTRYMSSAQDRRHAPDRRRRRALHRGRRRRARLSPPRLTSLASASSTTFTPGRADVPERAIRWRRFRQDGAVEYLGRNDHQVKIRGHRISELGEVETVREGPTSRP